VDAPTADDTLCAADARRQLMADTILLPTGTCFTDALDLIVEVLQANPADADALEAELVLVHGIVLERDRPTAHAWVEHEGGCVFKAILDGTAQYFRAARDEYYAELRVQETTRYTVHAARICNRQTRSYGPWQHYYRQHCTDAQEVPHA
jgi:hypothetical protein